MPPDILRDKSLALLPSGALQDLNVIDLLPEADCKHLLITDKSLIQKKLRFLGRPNTNYETNGWTDASKRIISLLHSR